MNPCILVSVIFSLSATIWDELPARFEECTRIVNADKRLQCFDALSKQFIVKKKSNYIQPKSEFMESELRVDKDRSDFRLKIKDLMDMLAIAKLDSGKKIEIYGWEMEANHYTLVIGMRTTTRLRFTHNNNMNVNYSVLAPVLVDGAITDPGLFILSIAAMTPDE